LIKAADSPAVRNFLAAFHRLRDRVADDPAMLEAEAQADPSVAKLCRDVGVAAFLLKNAQPRRSRFFSAPTMTRFVSDWRDYEARYARPVDGVVLAGAGLLAKAAALEFGESATEGTGEFDRKWDREQEGATSKADAVRTAMAFAEDEIEFQSERRECKEVLAERIRNGAQAWASLVEEADFDLADVFRRRQLTLSATVSRKPHGNYGASTDRPSLMARLHEAQEAFVFGVPLAAFALMRVVLDLVLTHYYAGKGETLIQKIHSAKERLPRSIGWSEVQRLENLVDDAVRLPRKEWRSIKDDERDTLALLEILRDLIEQAPA